MAVTETRYEETASALSQVQSDLEQSDTQLYLRALQLRS